MLVAAVWHREAAAVWHREAALGEEWPFASRTTQAWPGRRQKKQSLGVLRLVTPAIDIASSPMPSEARVDKAARHVLAQQFNVVPCSAVS